MDLAPLQRIRHRLVPEARTPRPSRPQFRYLASGVPPRFSLELLGCDFAPPLGAPHGLSRRKAGADACRVGELPYPPRIEELRRGPKFPDICRVARLADDEGDTFDPRLQRSPFLLEVFIAVVGPRER